jgi:hypothetical protein
MFTGYEALLSQRLGSPPTWTTEHFTNFYS